MARDEACVAPRLELMYPPSARQHAEARLSLHASWAILPSLNAVGGRIFTTDATQREDDPAIHCFWKLLFDFTSMNLVCIMEDRSLHPYVVGGHVGVATRWLARDDATSVAVLGSSRMAKGSLRAICAVRPITHVRVYSPTPVHRQAFARDAAETFGVEAVAVGSAEEAVREADIVACATNIFSVRDAPGVYSAEWLSPGTHVNTITRYEPDVASFRRAKIVPASLRGALEIMPPWEPFKSLLDRGAIPEENLPGDLVQVVTGQRPGRTSAEDVTLYLGVGLSVLQPAVAAWVYEAACEKGLGQRWELDA
jgi:alanine dehydrogenase